MANELINPSAKETQLSREQIELIKRTVAVGASDIELKLFLYQAEKRGLDPLASQIHFIKRKKYNPDTERYEEVGTIQTGIDGFRLIADRTGKLSGIKRGTIKDANGNLIGAWAEIYRSDWQHPAREEVSFDEYCQKKKDGSPMRLWATMPETMIKKVAEAAALRMAFPENLSGLYSHEEMTQADSDNIPVKITVQKATKPAGLIDKRGEFEKEGRDLQDEAFEQTSSRPEPKKPSDALEPTSEHSEEEMDTNIPQTFDELASWIAENMNWRDGKAARSWMLNKCKIPEDKMNDIEFCFNEVRQLQGWVK